MTTVATSTPSAIASPLRRLYLVRFAFALVWAGVLVTVGHQLGPVGATLLVLYPLFDLVAAVVDLRSSQVAGPRLQLYANMGVSFLAGVALAFAVTSGIPAVLRIWGVWAVVAGLIQLTVAIRRRAMGGQWPMIVSGSISTLAGISFVAQASTPAPSLNNVAAYAILGGIFFLVSALRLGRR